MLLNYHELTMNENRDSPQKKMQFRMICMVMATCIVITLIQSGAMRPVEVYEGEFPGGEFIYKTTGRDYAASMSLTESIAKDLELKEKHYANVMYNLYLDDPLAVNGRKQRFASGILLNPDTVTPKQESNSQRRDLLMGMNANIKKPSKKELEELAAWELWPRLHYHAQELPKTKAAVVEYTFSNGFVSALLHSYKVFPAIRQYAKEHGAPGSVPVVLTTCNITKSRCTHYVPLTDAESVFRLGKKEYDANESGGHVNWKGVRKMLLTVLSAGQMGGDLEYTAKDAPAPVKKESTTKPTTSEEAPKVEKVSEPVKEKKEEPPQKETVHEAESSEETPVQQSPETVTEDSAQQQTTDEPANENVEATTEGAPVEEQAPVDEVAEEETTTADVPAEDGARPTPEEATTQQTASETESTPEHPPTDQTHAQQAEEIHDPPVEEESLPTRDEL